MPGLRFSCAPPDGPCHIAKRQPELLDRSGLLGLGHCAADAG